MSRSELHPDIETVWDHLHRGWRCFISLEAIEERMHREGRRPVPSVPGMLMMNGSPFAEEVARVIAKPGPIQRETRKAVARNNRRRFGP